MPRLLLHACLRGRRGFALGLRPSIAALRQGLVVQATDVVKPILGKVVLRRCRLIHLVARPLRLRGLVAAGHGPLAQSRRRARRNYDQRCDYCFSRHTSTPTLRIHRRRRYQPTISPPCEIFNQGALTSCQSKTSSSLNGRSICRSVHEGPGEVSCPFPSWASLHRR